MKSFLSYCFSPSDPCKDHSSSLNTSSSNENTNAPLQSFVFSMENDENKEAFIGLVWKKQEDGTLTIANMNAKAISFFKHVNIGATIHAINDRPLSLHISLEDLLSQMALHTTTSVTFLQRPLLHSYDDPTILTAFPTPSGLCLPGMLNIEGEKETEKVVETPLPKSHYWMSDASVKNCHQCEKPFTTFRRKHHCRSCGQIFCYLHVVRFAFPPDMPIVPTMAWLAKELVCLDCFTSLQEGLHMALPSQTKRLSMGDALVILPSHLVTGPASLNAPTSSLRKKRVRAMGPTMSFDANDPFAGNLEEGINNEGDFDVDPLEKERRKHLFSMFDRVQVVTSTTHPPRPRVLPARMSFFSNSLLQNNTAHLKRNDISTTTILSSVRPRLRHRSLGLVRAWSDPNLYASKVHGEKRFYAILQRFSDFQAHESIALEDTYSDGVEGQSGRRLEAKAAQEETKDNEDDSNIDPEEAFDLIETFNFGLSGEAHCSSENESLVVEEQEIYQLMQHHAEKHISALLATHITTTKHLSKLPTCVRDEWKTIIFDFCIRAANSLQDISGKGESILTFVDIALFPLGGSREECKYIDGILYRKSLSRKRMRRQIEHPKILLIASSLEYRQALHIASLENVATQEVEYMHIIVGKIAAIGPDIVLFGGHVHRIAEEMLCTHGIVVAKNADLQVMYRIARSTGAMLLASADHVDKLPPLQILGACTELRVEMKEETVQENKTTGSKVNAHKYVHSRKKKQYLVFDGADASKGCTIILRGGTSELLQEVKTVLSAMIQCAFHLKLQRSCLSQFFLRPPGDYYSNVSTNSMTKLSRLWFNNSRCSSLYLQLRPNSLSLRAARRERQSWCKKCKTAASTAAAAVTLEQVMRVSVPDPLSPVFVSKRRENRSQSTTRFNVDSTEDACNCALRGREFRDKILLSTCWGNLDGKQAAQAELMCIDFYRNSDCTLSSFLETYCFRPVQKEFQLAFEKKKLTFTHDVGRIIITVQNVLQLYDTSTDGLSALKNMRDRQLLQLLKQRNDILMWTGKMKSTQVSTSFVKMNACTRNYSFGKFLEDIFYGIALETNADALFPHLVGCPTSDHSSFVRYFSSNGVVVRFGYERVEPVLHVTLQPVLWDDRRPSFFLRNAADLKELEHMAKEVYEITNTKILSSMSDLVLTGQSKLKLKIMKNEVRHWLDLFNYSLNSSPPSEVFAKNKLIREMYLKAVEWSDGISELMQSTVKFVSKPQDASPKGALPRAWFGKADEEVVEVPADDTSGDALSPFFSMLQPPSKKSSQPPSARKMEAGSMGQLAAYAKQVAAGEYVPSPTTPLLRMSSSDDSELFLTSPSSSKSKKGGTPKELFNTMMFNNSSPFSSPLKFEDLSTLAVDVDNPIASLYREEKIAPERTNHIRTEKASGKGGLGYFEIPLRILQWHPSLPLGVEDVVVLVNAKQPTSAVAYSLCSVEYTRILNDHINHAIPNACGWQSAVTVDVQPVVDENMLQLLKSSHKSDVETTFAGESRFHTATKFKVKSHYAMQFHALRRLYYGGDRKFVESLCHCETWAADGGKSGAGFLKTQDQRFIAKAIPAIELQMFLSMATEYFAYMSNTLENNLCSMLSKILGVYEVSIQDVAGGENTTMCILMMENLIYGRHVHYLYDLKGKMEGRFKTQSNAHAALWDQNFVEMTRGLPLPLQESALSLLLSASVNDTKFLSSVQATDYSMLIGYDTTNREVVACIIDYIHKYDLLKMVEYAGKRLIQEEGEITVLNPKQYRKRFRKSVLKYFCAVPGRHNTVMAVSTEDSLIDTNISTSKSRGNIISSNNKNLHENGTLLI